MTIALLTPDELIEPPHGIKNIFSLSFRRVANAAFMLKPTDAPAITASPRIMPAPPSALSVEPLTRSRSCLTEPPTATARHHTAAQRAHARA